MEFVGADCLSVRTGPRDRRSRSRGGQGGYQVPGRRHWWGRLHGQLLRHLRKLAADREQNCNNHATFTYNSPDPDKKGEHTYGGYSDKIVVAEHFVIRIPPGMDLAATAPLLCAGITTFSPMQHWKLAANQRVGVIGLGGLGHMAVKLAVARNAEVTVFTTTPGKIDDAKKMGAKEAILWNDAEALKRLANCFDLLISTVPKAYSMQPFVNVLKLDATLVDVGAMEQIQGVIGNELVHGRKVSQVL